MFWNHMKNYSMLATDLSHEDCHGCVGIVDRTKPWQQRHHRHTCVDTTSFITRVADPRSWIWCFFTPAIRDKFFRIRILDDYKKRKMLIFIFHPFLCWIRVPGYKMFGSGMEKCSDPDPGKNIPDPQHCCRRNKFSPLLRIRMISVWIRLWISNTGFHNIKSQFNLVHTQKIKTEPKRVPLRFRSTDKFFWSRSLKITPFIAYTRMMRNWTTKKASKWFLIHMFNL
jgi:hypothetical protein